MERDRLLRRLARHLVIVRSPGQLSSDAGLLSIRPFDQRIGITRAFDAAVHFRGDCGFGVPEMYAVCVARSALEIGV